MSDWYRQWPPLRDGTAFKKEEPAQSDSVDPSQVRGNRVEGAEDESAASVPVKVSNLAQRAGPL